MKEEIGMMEYDRAQLKQSARQAVKFQRPHPMLVTLLFTVVVNIGSQIVNGILGFASGSSTLAAMYAEALLDYSDLDYAVQYVLLSFGPQRLALALFLGVFVAGIVTSLWSTLMRTGYSGFCLDMVRGRQPQTDALFRAFPQWASVLLTQLLVSVFRFLWTLLLQVGAVVVFFVILLLFITILDLPALAFLLMLCGCIALMLGIIWVTLRYAMVDFLIADQGLTGMEAIRESRRMMLGNTGRLFTLKLSFLGWYLMEAGIVLAIGIPAVYNHTASASSPSAVGIPTGVFASLGLFGLGSIALIAIAIFNLWLTPYITGAEALFYDRLRGVDSTPAGGYGWGPGGGWGQPPRSPDQPGHFDYTWTPGPTSGTGIGSGPKNGGGNPPQPPKPKSPRDDPWD